MNAFPSNCTSSLAWFALPDLYEVIPLAKYSLLLPYGTKSLFNVTAPVNPLTYETPATVIEIQLPRTLYGVIANIYNDPVSVEMYLSPTIAVETLILSASNPE